MNAAQTRLSVVIITLNEATNIRACLDSVRWADEIVVLDSGSADETTAIAREFTDKVFIDHDWRGFGVQKNRALAHATGDWVLSVDADERVSETLHEEILAAVRVPGDHHAFAIPRRSFYCGRFMRHGGWWPDYVTRLFRRETCRFSDDLVHERVVHPGVAGRLQAPLEHITYRNLEQMLGKLNHYSSAGAANLAAKGRRGGLGRALSHGLWMFLRTYLLRGGFLDGREGFMLAVSSAETTYYRYLKLMYLEQDTGGPAPPA